MTLARFCPIYEYKLDKCVGHLNKGHLWKEFVPADTPPEVFFRCQKTKSGSLGGGEKIIAPVHIFPQSIIKFSSQETLSYNTKYRDRQWHP